MIDTLKEIKELRPELRVGQIISNALAYTHWKDEDIFHVPDEVLGNALYSFLLFLQKQEK